MEQRNGGDAVGFELATSPVTSIAAPVTEEDCRQTSFCMRSLHPARMPGRGPVLHRDWPQDTPVAAEHTCRKMLSLAVWDGLIPVARRIFTFEYKL